MLFENEGITKKRNSVDNEEYISEETQDGNNQKRKRPVRNVKYADDLEEEEEKLVLVRRVLGPGHTSSSKDLRANSRLQDYEHANLYTIVQLLERNEECSVLHLKGSNFKSKSPGLIPIFSSIRTKARRKRYKCLQDCLDHFKLLFDSLGFLDSFGTPSREYALVRNFESLFKSYFADALVEYSFLDTISGQDSSAGSIENIENEEAYHA